MPTFDSEVDIVCHSFRNANVDESTIKNTPVSLEHERELKLAKVLLRFPDMIVRIADDLFLHPLCEFMYEVATAFTEFYDVCYCVEKDQVFFDVVLFDTLALLP